MLIEKKEVDEWTSKDFVNYISSACKVHNIIFELDAKKDYMYVGQVLKRIKHNNLSYMWLKKRIDAYLLREGLTTIQSLKFLMNFVSMLPKNINRKTAYFYEDNELSDNCLDKLDKLRACI